MPRTHARAAAGKRTLRAGSARAALAKSPVRARRCGRTRSATAHRVDAKREEEARVAPVNDLVRAKLDKVGKLIVARRDQAVHLRRRERGAAAGSQRQRVRERARREKKNRTTGKAHARARAPSPRPRSCACPPLQWPRTTCSAASCLAGSAAGKSGSARRRGRTGKGAKKREREREEATDVLNERAGGGEKHHALIGRSSAGEHAPSSRAGVCVCVCKRNAHKRAEPARARDASEAPSAYGPVRDKITLSDSKP